MQAFNPRSVWSINRWMRLPQMLFGVRASQLDTYEQQAQTAKRFAKDKSQSEVRDIKQWHPGGLCMALVSQSYCVQTSWKARPRSPFPWLNCIQLIHILRAWEALRAASIQMPVFCVRALSAVLNSLLPSSLFSLFFLVARAYRRRCDYCI